MKPYSYYSYLTVEFPNKYDYTVKYYYKKGKLICIKKPFCDTIEVPSDSVEETVFDKEGYELHKEAWAKGKAELEREFKKDLIRLEGLDPSEKVDECFALAWDYGYSEGFKAVHDHFIEFSALLK